MTETSTPKGIQMIRGLPFPDLPWFRKENIESGLDYTPHDGDIVISSYPKTGTTWLQYIVHQIVYRGDTPPSMDDMTFRIIPFMDMVGSETIDALENPRIYKHHLPYDVLKKNPKAKYLYIYRNPEDTLVSYYHFMKNLTDEDMDFDKFYEGFMTGDIGYGRYFEHVLSYLSSEGGNVLMVSYEDLRENAKEGILRIAKFIGVEYYKNIAEDEFILKKILLHTSFEYMKNNLSVLIPDNGNGAKSVNFFRKGNVGDGKKTLTTQQMKRLSILMEEIMKGTHVLNEWKRHK